MKTSAITRRQALLGAAAASLLKAAGKERSRLSLEGYIWQNYASREKKPLVEMLDELFATAPYAGSRTLKSITDFLLPP
jgi:hypothetical protein